MIDLYSDTVTRPTPAMRTIIAQAEVGDEQRGADPTTLRLEEHCASLLGKDKAVFLPSATMANAIAIQLHCEPGDELLAAENSHIISHEAGGAAVHARACPRGIPSWTGIFGRNGVSDRLRLESLHAPRVRLVVIENTTNQGGGRPWPEETQDEVTAFARANHLRLHLDGSRLFNAAVATGQAPSRLARDFDTVTLCFSKGLGCPLGALLAVPAHLHQRARRLKQMMGGGMRQTGMMAAAALYSLEHHVERLADDHRRAARLARKLSEIDPLIVEQIPLRTNMVFFEIPDSYDALRFQQALQEAGLSVSRVQRQRFRAVTHLDVTDLDIERAVTLVTRVCAAGLTP